MRWFVPILFVCACGSSDPIDPSAGDSQDGESTAQGDSTTTSTASSDASTSTADPSTTGGMTTAVDSSTGSDPETTSESTVDPTVSESSGGAAIEYAAVAIVGGLNRIRITKRNDDAGICTYLTLVDPSDAGMFDAIDITDPWGAEFANGTDLPRACDSDNPGMFGGEGATDATGSITLANPGASGFPCTVDVDVTLTFAGVIEALPDMDVMSANGIAVQGC